MIDDDLIKRCQNGDKAAFGTLLGEQYDVMYRFTYRWCNDQHNAQDITQQACLKLARAIVQFNFQSSFTPWLYRLVINCAKGFYKSPSQHNVREQSQHDPQIESAFDSSVQLDDRSEQRLYSQQILEYINTLQNDLRDTLILVYAQGLSHRQAAQLLQVKRVPSRGVYTKPANS